MSVRHSVIIPPAQSKIARHVVALGMFAILGIFATWPTPLHFTTQGLGEHHVDRAQSIWNLWWIKVALLDRHSNPFHTDLLFFPQGADLYLHDLSLPTALILLGPMLIFGLIAAYNFGMILAITLTGYAGFRLVYYLLRHYAGALIGGLIIGFNPLMQEWLRGHINLLNAQWFVLCIEFYLRAWTEGRRRDAILAGLFAALALLTVGYYEVYLLIFFVAHLTLSVGCSLLGTQCSFLIPGTQRSESGNLHLIRRAGFVAAWGGGIAVLLSAPYVVGAWLSLQKGQVIIRSQLDVERTIVDSADLLSFIIPDRDHWLFGLHAPWWAWVNPAIHDYTTLGLVTLGLAGIGVWAGRRMPASWFWVALAGLGAILALGPVLQVNGQHSFGSIEIPLPYNLLQYIPPFSAMRAPERYTFLTYLALAILGGRGVMWLSQGSKGRAQRSESGVIQDSPLQYSRLMLVGLLILLELPFHFRFTEPMPIPSSMTALGLVRAPGAVLELPMTQHGWVDTPRMYYQVAHGRPITSGYLSRPIIDPYSEACSPFQAFSAYQHTEAQDIVSPTTAGMLPELLADNGIGFIAVYKQVYVNPDSLSLLPEKQLTELQTLANRLGTPLSDDEVASTYRLHPTSGHTRLFLQLGPDWHQLEESYGQPFRWINGSHADLCVFNPAPLSAPLTFNVASFGTQRHLQVWVDSKLVYEQLIPADGALHRVTTPPLEWSGAGQIGGQIGGQIVKLVSTEQSSSPQSLGEGNDKRQLSLGFADIRLSGSLP